MNQESNDSGVPPAAMGENAVSVLPIADLEVS